MLGCGSAAPGGCLILPASLCNHSSLLALLWTRLTSRGPTLGMLQLLYLFGQDVTFSGRTSLPTPFKNDTSNSAPSLPCFLSCQPTHCRLYLCACPLPSWELRGGRDCGLLFTAESPVPSTESSTNQTLKYLLNEEIAVPGMCRANRNGEGSVPWNAIWWRTPPAHTGM